MSTGQIQLGVKRSSGKFLDRYSAQGFFYGGDNPTERPVQGTNQVTPEEISVSTEATPDYEKLGFLIVEIPARQHLIFYDIPSRKRDSGCTNILHTGTLPSVRGEGQRLRKGFQGQWRGSLTMELMKSGSETKVHRISLCQRPIVANQLSIFESLSSAAEIRHPGRIRGYEESPLPCLHL